MQLDARLSVSEIEGLEPSPPPARGSRDGGGRGRGGFGGGRDGGGRGRDGGGRRFEGESNFKRREGGDDRPRRLMTVLNVISVIVQRHVVKVVSVIVHNVRLMTVLNAISVIVQHHVVKVVSVIVHNVALVINHVLRMITVATV